MNARTSWNAPADNRSREDGRDVGDDDPTLPLDDILDARFDEAGRLAQIGRGGRQRIAERLDPRPAAMSTEELDRAVRKLSLGLEAIERQGSPARMPETRTARPRGIQPPEAGSQRELRNRDFVAYSLDRLEARLESLSKRLQQRAGVAAAAERAAAPASLPPAADAGEGTATAGELAEDAAIDPVHGDGRRQLFAEAEASLAVLDRDVWTNDPTFAADPLPDPPTEGQAAQREPTAAIARARLGAEQAQERRRAGTAGGEPFSADAEARRLAEVAEARRLAEGAGFADALRLSQEAEIRDAQGVADQAAAAEAGRAGDEPAAVEARRQVPEGGRAQSHAAEARLEIESPADLKRQLAALQARIETLQQSCDQNRIAPVRAELMALLGEIEVLNREGRSISGTVEQVHARLDQVESKLNAARNLTGNRLGELQDRLSGLTERLGDVEAEIPGFDALRENQTAILERFDRIEGLVHRFASPEDILERVDGLRRQLQSTASHGEVRRIEEQILQLVDRLDSLPDALGDGPVLERIETQLQTLASELLEARRHRMSSAAALDQHFAELATALQGVGEAARTPDLSGLEGLVSQVAGRLEEDRRTAGETLSRLEQRLADLTEAVSEQEDEATKLILAGLTSRMDSLVEAMSAEDMRGSRRDLQALDGKLGQLSQALSEQAEYLSRSQAASLEARLDGTQARLEEMSQASLAQFGPFAQKLQEISDRLSGANETQGAADLSARLGAIEDRLAGLTAKAPDSRALNMQLESIVSRLELLKGRSIDPARLTDLFERVDEAIRGGLGDERLARLEQSGEAAGALLTQDDLAELRADIIALRRELRSLPNLDGETDIAGALHTISARLERLADDPPATAVELEAQIERIAQRFEDPTHSRLTLAHIESSLKAIEARLGDTRRSMLIGPVDEAGVHAADGDIDAVAGLARALSEDVSVLRNATAASDQKTKDALEAVQDTLEAVVKRMAFLERDADAAAAAPDESRLPPAQAIAPQPTSGTLVPASEPVVFEAQETPVLAPAGKPEGARDAAAGGLFSRFTSSQLLKRATGGRAESFSPEAEDTEEAGDLPLEPGTDAPLSSALTGAPSSDTALMSGGRAKAKADPGGRRADLQPIRARDVSAEPASPDDFLAAARRAAKAAAEEAVEAEHGSKRSLGIGRIFGVFKTRRSVVLAGLLAIAVAVAAMQIVRNQMDTGEIEIAGAADLSLPDEQARSAEPAAAELPLEREVAASEPQPSPSPPPAIPAPAPPQAAARVTPPVPTAPPPQVPFTMTDATDAGETSDADPAPDAPVETAPQPAPAVTASVAPTATVPSSPAAAPSSPPRAAATPAAAPGTRPVPADIPAAIGPGRLREAAMAGDPIAAFEVAARYAEGRGTPQDVPAAVAWYRHAAEMGLAPAQYRLGSIYEKGLGVPKDPVAAQNWYRRAAEAGNVKAMHNLAVLHAEGVGGEPDLERAAALFRQAAEHGVRDSQFNLAILHARGLGVPQDMLEAYKWFAVAANSGDQESVKRRDIIAAALSPEDLAKAQAAATSFQPLPLIAEANDVMMPEGGWGEDTTSLDLQSEKSVVSLVQTLLAERGFDPGPADGMLGRQTIQAITAFQEQAGLPTTGQIDKGLVAALQDQST